MGYFYSGNAEFAIFVGGNAEMAIMNGSGMNQNMIRKCGIDNFICVPLYYYCREGGNI
jgi:hypothetical protein